MPSKKIIAGVDEVGRGSLFGPVFASAVVLDHIAENQLISAGLKDSKLLSRNARGKLIPLIKKQSKAWSIGQASSREIDLFGIREATERAMVRALQRIRIPIDLVLVDGKLPIRLWEGDQQALVRGESKSTAIAAASVLAKETRDALIRRLANYFKGYGLESHVGYGTKLHRNAIIASGPTVLHRHTFLSKIISQKNFLSQ